MDERIITRIPKDMGGLKMTVNSEFISLQEGGWLLVLKALYGYRKSSKLWQMYF